jgi:nitronate monooxygenase
MALPPLFDKLRLPMVGAPLFIISNPDLVVAQCSAGIVGGFPALNAEARLLEHTLVPRDWVDPDGH